MKNKKKMLIIGNVLLALFLILVIVVNSVALYWSQALDPCPNRVTLSPSGRGRVFSFFRRIAPSSTTVFTNSSAEREILAGIKKAGFGKTVVHFSEE